MKTKKTRNRCKWVILLIAALILPPLYFVLAGGNAEPEMEIVSFEELDAEILNQFVPLGTSLDELELPPSLQVVVKTLSTQPAVESGKNGQTDTTEKNETTIEPTPEVEITSGGSLVVELVSEESEQVDPEPDENSELPTEEELEPEENSEQLTEEELEPESETKEEEPDDLEEDEPKEPTPSVESFLLTTTAIDVEWESSPPYDGDIAGTYTFTPIIPKNYILSAEPPKITVNVVSMTKNASIIRVTTPNELKMVFSHGALVGGSLNWHGERIVEMAFSNLGGEINSHENFWSIAPIGTTRSITLISDGELRELKTTRNSLHFRIGAQVELKLVDPNLHIVGNNPNANVATEMAGGIRVQGGRLELWEGTIRENFGIWGQNAVFITFGGSFLMQGGTIENNRSDFGGGMSASGFGTKFDMYGGVFQNNFASIYSGGVDIDAGAEFNMYGGKIINNIADGEGGGGGLRVDSGSLFNMFDGLIEGNRVTSNSLYPTGGGVSVYDPDTTFNMNGGIIGGNFAHRGGGVGVVNAIFNLGTGRTERGRAPDNQTGTVNNPQITGNTATSGGIDADLVTGGNAGGGGVYVLGTSGANLTNFIMHSGQIVGNNSLYRGGGVYLISAIMNMKGGEIAGNKTTNNSDNRSGGGGVYLHNYYADWGFPSKFIMRGGMIRNNESREGGAIKRNDYRLVIDISGCSVISGNIAHTLGGGISTESTPANSAPLSAFNLESSRNNLTVGESVWFSGNRSLAPVSYGLKVSEVRTHSPYLYGRIKWNGKNSVGGQSETNSSFHLLNNHDIANLQGTPINFDDIAENNPFEPTLVISKTLSSDDSTGLDFANRGIYFDFSVTISKSNCNPNYSQKYRAYLMDENGVVVNVNENFDGEILTDTKYGSYIELPTGATTKVRLKHGQWLSFVDIERDASYMVTEHKSPGITQSCVQKVNGVPSTYNAPQEADLKLPETKITGGEDRADFFNTSIQVVPVGYFANSLPFILLICFAGLALVAVGATKFNRLLAQQ